MKHKQAFTGMALDRRGFLAGMSVTLGNLPLQTLADEPGTRPVLPSRQVPPQRAVYQGLAYIDHDGLGQPWDKPPGNQATRDYVNSISREDFLRRHWFT